MPESLAAEIWFDVVQPDSSRTWYRHCYGLRGRAWAVHGHFERVYYIAPDYIEGPLRRHLEQTLVSVWAVIESELRAAIDAPVSARYADAAKPYLANPALREQPGIEPHD